MADMPTLNRRSHRLRDFSLYVLIAVAVAGLAILIGVHSAKTGQQPDVVFKWVGLALNTVFVFGCSLRAVRPFLKRPKLWGVAGGLLLATRNDRSLGHFSGRACSLDLVRAARCCRNQRANPSAFLGLGRRQGAKSIALAYRLTKIRFATEWLEAVFG